MANFNGKNILIIGGSSGIGRELAGLLLQAGAGVTTASRSQPADLGNAAYLPLDVEQPVGEALSSLPETLHGLVYCPGTINLRPFNRLTEGDFLKDFRINVLGAVNVIQACLPRLKQSQGAGVVLFSTVAARLGLNFHTSIATAKSALEGLAVSLAAELSTSRIRVNVIAPSLTDTPLAKLLLSSDEKREASNKRHPLGRVGTPADIAAAAAFLLSDEASWITGQVLGIDGGLSNLKPL
ncbi:MAG: SDR family oxidoreductase [Ferruginibacter sp.]|nr:SDR family oxidoreductase [Cytophagales bacterium]